MGKWLLKAWNGTEHLNSFYLAKRDASVWHEKCGHVSATRNQLIAASENNVSKGESC